LEIFENAKNFPQPIPNFLKIVGNHSFHQNDNFQLIKTALNNMGEMAIGTNLSVIEPDLFNYFICKSN
jgi:hypothetical protein